MTTKTLINRNKYWREQLIELESIGEYTGMTFVQKIATELNPKKCNYTNDVYIALLRMIKNLIKNGAEPNAALESIKIGLELHKILELLNEGKMFSDSHI